MSVRYLEEKGYFILVVRKDWFNWIVKDRDSILVSRSRKVSFGKGEKKMNIVGYYLVEIKENI